jgi:hypothetical protein
MSRAHREKRAVRRTIIRYLGGYKKVTAEVRKGIDKKYKVQPIFCTIPYDEAEFFHNAAVDAKVSKICSPYELVRLCRTTYKWQIIK